MRRTGLSCAPTLAGLSVAFGLCGTPGASAQAQTAPSLDLRTWRPSPDPRANLILEPVTTPGSWQWSVGAWAQYAEDPVVLRAPTGAEVRPVAHLLAADFVASVGLGDRASVGLDVPAFLWQEGAGTLSSGIVRGGKAPTTGLGDASVMGKVTLASDDRQGVLAGWGLAVLGAASIPTGNRAGFESDGALGISLQLLAEYALAVGAVRAVLGYSARSERTWPEAPDGTTFGNAIPWAIGGILRPKALAPALDPGDRQQWEIAAHGELPAGPVAPFGLGGAGASMLSPALLAIDDRVALGHHRDAYVLIGGDFGLDAAAGVPVLRAVASLGWAARSHDRDADGVSDDRDECPDLPEDRDGVQDADGCPEDDADGDGILDPEDACPRVAGVASADPTRNGCPGASPESVTPSSPGAEKNP